MERKAVAWMPPTSSKGLADALVIRQPPGKLTEDDFRGLLAIRFQNLINRQENPQEATDDAAAILQKAGLWDGLMPTPADEAGSILIYSNMAMPTLLTLIGVEPGPYQIKRPTIAAELALQRDKQPKGRPQEILMRLVNALQAQESDQTI